MPWVEPGLPRALNALSDRQRVAVVLVCGFGWQLREVAELFGVKTTTVPGPRDTVSVAELGCAHPQPVSAFLQVASAIAGELQIKIVNFHNGSEATLFWERTAIDESTMRGRDYDFDVPGAACPGNTQTIEVIVDGAEPGQDEDITMQLVLPPPSADGIEHVVVSSPTL